MLQAYDKISNTLYDIVKTKDNHYMLRNQKGWLTGPVDKTRAQLIRLCKKVWHMQVF